MEHQISKRFTVIFSLWLILLFSWIGGVAYIVDRADQDYRDSTYYYKVMRSPVRSINQYDITEDTAFINRLERSTKELRK